MIWLAVIAGLLFGLLARCRIACFAARASCASVGERELRLGALGAGAAVLLGVIVATLALARRP